MVDKDCQTVRPHGYDLASAYPCVFTNFSYARHGRTHPGGMIDQFWYTSESMVNLGYRNLFISEEQKKLMKQTSSILVSNPSDHVPIAACFAWRKSKSKIDIGNKAKLFVLHAQGGSALAADALHNDSQAKDDPLALGKNIHKENLSSIKTYDARRESNLRKAHTQPFVCYLKT